MTSSEAIVNRTVALTTAACATTAPTTQTSGTASASAPADGSAPVTGGAAQVKVTLTKDLYLNLTREPTADDPTIRLRIVVEPLILWLWIGGTIMLIGTGLSAFPGRRRNPLAPVSEVAA